MVVTTFRSFLKNCTCDSDHDYTWLNNYSRKSLEAVTVNAENAFRQWAKGISGKPHFKSRQLGDIRFPAPRISRTRNGISSEKIGSLKLKRSLPKCPKDAHYANPVISYDKDKFKYTNNSNDIIQEFIAFIEDLPLLIIDNSYTKDYLESIKNKKESIFKYLDMDFSDDVFDKLIKKYNLEPSNHLVDLLYESLIYEINDSSK